MQFIKIVDHFYNKEMNWSSYLESDNPVTYTAEKDLDEEKYASYFVEKKYTDGLLLAVKDPSRDKVKVYKKNMQLFHA